MRVVVIPLSFRPSTSADAGDAEKEREKKLLSRRIRISITIPLPPMGERGERLIAEERERERERPRAGKVGEKALSLSLSLFGSLSFLFLPSSKAGVRTGSLSLLLGDHRRTGGEASFEAGFPGKKRSFSIPLGAAILAAREVAWLSVLHWGSRLWNEREKRKLFLPSSQSWELFDGLTIK